MGGSGFIGSELALALVAAGWRIRLLSRQRLNSFTISFPCEFICWDGKLMPEDALVGVEAVINLVGEGVANAPWTPSYRRKLRDSRLDSVLALKAALRATRQAPVVIQASAIGYYGESRGKEILEETSPSGKGELAELCRDWEEAAKGLSTLTKRLVILRIGLVLGVFGGAFPKIWDLYASGLGAVLGDGRQWMNWIHVADLVRIISSALEKDAWQGTYNAISPGNVSNRDFHRALVSLSPSRSFAVAPRLLLKLGLGARATLLLSGPQIVSRRLEILNFAFLYPTLPQALAAMQAGRSHPEAHLLVSRQWLPCKLEAVWEFVSAASNLSRVTPPWLNFKLLTASDPSPQKGSIYDYRLAWHGLPLRWRSEICEWLPPKSFVDRQLKGPYRLWRHSHSFRVLADGVLLEDRVEYSLPFFPFGQLAFGLVHKELVDVFSYRRKAFARILASSP